MTIDVGRGGNAETGSREPSPEGLGPAGFDPARIYGYFDGPGDTPRHDPGEQAPCPGCGKPVTREGVRSQSILVPGDYRCYFVRYHIACAESPGVDEAVNWIVDNRFLVADALNEANGTTSDDVLASYLRGASPQDDAQTGAA